LIEGDWVSWWSAAVSVGELPLAEYGGDASHSVYFDHFSALGSDTQWTEYAGGSGNELVFYPWGVEWEDTGFGGYQTFGSLTLYDPPTDGYVTPNRHFVPTQGRWLSPDLLAGDILNPQPLNRYRYDPFPNDPAARAGCIEAARKKRDFCLNKKIPGPVQ
jgi:hypothetical protein